MWHEPLWQFACFLWSFPAPWGLVCHSTILFLVPSIWWWTWLSLSRLPKLIFEPPFLVWWCLWCFFCPEPPSRWYQLHDEYSAATTPHAQSSQNIFPPHHKVLLLHLFLDFPQLLNLYLFVVVEGKAPSTPHGDNICLWIDEEGKVPSTSRGENTFLAAAKCLIVPLWYVNYTSTSKILVPLTSSLVFPWLGGPPFSWCTGEGILGPINISWAMIVSQGMLIRLRWWRTMILIKE